MSTDDTAKEPLSGVIADAVRRKESAPYKTGSRWRINTSTISLIDSDTKEENKNDIDDENEVKVLEEQKRLHNL